MSYYDYSDEDIEGSTTPMLSSQGTRATSSMQAPHSFLNSSHQIGRAYEQGQSPGSHAMIADKSPEAALLSLDTPSDCRRANDRIGEQSSTEQAAIGQQIKLSTDEHQDVSDFSLPPPMLPKRDDRKYRYDPDSDEPIMSRIIDEEVLIKAPGFPEFTDSQLQTARILRRISIKVDSEVEAIANILGRQGLARLNRSARSFPSSRVPPPTPPEHTTEGVSMPTIPAVHHNSVPALVERYREERAQNPNIFDQQTEELKASLIRAKIARGGNPFLLRGELTAELASRLDAEAHSRYNFTQHVLTPHIEGIERALDSDEDDFDCGVESTKQSPESFQLPAGFELSDHVSKTIYEGEVSFRIWSVTDGMGESTQQEKRLYMDLKEKAIQVSHVTWLDVIQAIYGDDSNNSNDKNLCQSDGGKTKAVPPMNIRDDDITIKIADVLAALGVQG